MGLFVVVVYSLFVVVVYSLFVVVYSLFAVVYLCLLTSVKCNNVILYSYRGRNYLHLACEQNDIDMVRLILDSCPKGRAGDDFLDLTVPLVTLVDHDNLTPIHTAAKKCDYQVSSTKV